jgi:hypothetical protein
MEVAAGEAGIKRPAAPNKSQKPPTAAGNRIPARAASRHRRLAGRALILDRLEN